MRLAGWESRLVAVIEDARTRPYVLGEHDCFRLACRVVEALTGIDRWPQFRGYKTKRQSLVKIAQYGSTFEAAGDWFFGERIEHNFARRGDIAALQPDPAGEKHLGIVTGRSIVVLTEGGTGAVPLRDALCIWRIG